MTGHGGLFSTEHRVVVPSVHVVGTAAWCTGHDEIINNWSKAVKHLPPSWSFFGAQEFLKSFTFFPLSWIQHQRQKWRFKIHCILSPLFTASCWNWLFFSTFWQWGREQEQGSLWVWYRRVGTNPWVVGKRWGLCDIMKGWYRVLGKNWEKNMISEGSETWNPRGGDWQRSATDRWRDTDKVDSANMGPWTLKGPSPRQHLNGTSCQCGRHGACLIQIGVSIKTLAWSGSRKSIGHDEETSVNPVD